jgi:hypothetical protein
MSKQIEVVGLGNLAVDAADLQRVSANVVDTLQRGILIRRTVSFQVAARTSAMKPRITVCPASYGALA